MQASAASAASATASSSPSPSPSPAARFPRRRPAPPCAASSPPASSASPSAPPLPLPLGTPFGAAGEKTVLVPIGHGFEEIEAVVLVDVLRRAGAKVTLASVEETLTVTGSRGIKVLADVPIAFVAESAFHLVALPGGMPGSERLRDSPELLGLLRRQRAAGGLYAAICAAPAVVLQSQGLLSGSPPKKATAHPAFVSKLEDPSLVERRVVVDGKLVTSRGPGTALEFALALVEQLFGPEKKREVAGPMVMAPGWESL